jgi:hypothetical protein
LFGTKEIVTGDQFLWEYLDSTDRLGFPVAGDMRVQGWVWPRQTAACAAGAEPLAEVDTAHAAAILSGFCKTRAL